GNNNRNRIMDGAIAMPFNAASFNARTLDKVERLFDLLAEINRHPQLAGKLCLHGGTAINLFLLDIPRLSVDIDMSYIGKAEREEMLAERPAIESAIEQVGAFLGYNVTSGKGDHAGRTFRFLYHGAAGADYVKIDMIYLNRVALLPPLQMTSAFRPSVPVAVFAGPELIGGKIKAFYDRVKVRDLYDIANLDSYMRHAIENSYYTEELCHKLALFHAAISKRFPQPLEDRASKVFWGEGTK
ncbi:MAG: nucleotidyl transferase AbiEii/AbiGii toxin family protein, partial [Oscillospiraceae bacterium]